VAATLFSGELKFLSDTGEYESRRIAIKRFRIYETSDWKQVQKAGSLGTRFVLLLIVCLRPSSGETFSYKRATFLGGL
jgi:hypothetical protein